MALLAAAFVVVFGLQLLRGMVAGLSVYLGQVRDLDPLLLGGLIFAVFLAGFGARLVRLLLGVGWAFPILAAVLALLRLAEQFSSQPDARLIIEIAGVVVWLWLVPLVLAGDHAVGKRRDAASPVVALLLGLTFDTAIKGAFGTLDLSFAAGLAPQLTTVALTCAQLGLILLMARTRAQAESAIALPASAYVVGSGLALHLLIFQNIAHHAALIGWSLPAVFAWTLAANLIAIWAVVWLSRRASGLPRWASVGAAGLLVASVAPGLSPALAAIAALVGPVAIAVLWTPALAGSSGDRRGWVAVALGLLAIPVVLFGWYAHYEIAVPIPQWLIPLVAGLLVAGPVWVWSPPSVPCSSQGQAPAGHLPPHYGGRVGIGVAVGAILLLLLPLYQFLAWNSPPAPPAEGSSLRVMTYNIHQGFDLSGRPGLEGVAEAIEAEQAQIVGLQEVPRGWVVNGSVDALSWLAQRLGMHAAWGPAADPFWGNAILSRYPIVRVENAPMPDNADILFDRAYLVVTIEVGGKQLQVVATHLHHVQRERQHRLPQVRALIEGVDWSRPTILLGDLNAQPQHEELRLLLRAGLATSERPIPTYPSDRARRQLDYVLVTPHFALSEATAIRTTASDHRPLAATLIRVEAAQ